MRILFITNYYPPCRFGWGYMQLCEEVVDRLVERGHTVSVLTSTERHGPEIERPYPVQRQLQIELDWENGTSAPKRFFLGRRQREQVAQQQVRHAIQQFQPEAVFIWHMVGIPRLALQEAQHMMNGRVAFYLADYQPEIADEYMGYWEGAPTHGLARLFKQPLAAIALNQLAKEGKPIPLDFHHVACVSGYVRDRLVRQKLISEQAVVIHNGVDLAHFSRERFKKTAPVRAADSLFGGRSVGGRKRGSHRGRWLWPVDCRESAARLSDNLGRW